MRILVDTHILLWSFLDPEKIPQKVKMGILDEENDIFYSQASLWEISIKYTLGKLKLNGIEPEDFYEEIENSYYRCKRIENDEMISFHRLLREHKDPFDRLIVWQCIRSEFVFASVDARIETYKQYGLRVLS